MTSATSLRRIASPLPFDRFVATWSKLHSEVPFVINNDQVHCLQTVAFNDARDDVARLLLRKLAMGKLVHPHRMPVDVIALRATAEFCFGSCDVQRLRVVHPHGVRCSTDISVASPIGAGLIGLAAGQQILWPDDQGTLRELCILKVDYDAGALNSPPRGTPRAL